MTMALAYMRKQLYPPILTPFRYRQDKPMNGDWRKPEMKMLAGEEWTWTELIQGTHCRVIWNGSKISFAGRDNSPLTRLFPDQRRILKGLFPEEVVWGLYGSHPVILYGVLRMLSEDVPEFVLHDVAREMFMKPAFYYWERPEEVFSVANSDLLITAVNPGLKYALSSMIISMRNGNRYMPGSSEPIHGMVGTVKHGLLDWAGNPIKVKILTSEMEAL